MKNSIIGLLTFAFSGGLIHAADIDYTGVSGGEWITDNNWSGASYPGTGDVAVLDTVANFSVPSPNNIQGLRVGTNGEGRLQIGSQARLIATTNASDTSIIGQGNGNVGHVQHEGAILTINRLKIGGNGGTGSYLLHHGELTISRGSNGHALFLGSDASGTGTFRISSGSLITRTGVLLGSNSGGIGRFEVIGSHPGTIGIGSTGTGDGLWTQHPGSTLSVRIDKTPQGVTPIFIKDEATAGEGASHLGGDVIFENGALLEVDFTGEFVNGGTFTAMEWEGDVTDNGLQFAPSVDTNLWSFQVDAVNKRLTVTAAGNPISRNFVHPGTTHTRSDLERMRDMVAAGVEPYATSFQRLSSNSSASYNYNVRKDPTATAIVGRTAMTSDGTAAYYNALMWNITGDERHAQKAVEIFNAYSNVTSMDFSIPLEAGLAGWRMLDAAEMIKHTYDSWAQADIDSFSDMLVHPGYSNTTVPTADIAADNITLYWKLYNGDPRRAGNQGIHCMRTMLALGIFLDNELIYDRALRYLQGAPARVDDIPYPTGPPINGAAEDNGPYRINYPHTGVETTVPDYGYDELIHNYVWPNGQCQETSRDQDHALGGVHILTLASEMAWSQGDDLYGHLDNRILVGMEFAVRYNLTYNNTYPDQLTPWEPRVETGEYIQRLSRTGRNFSLQPNPYFDNSGPDGRLSRGQRNDHPVYESNLAHYRDRLGLPSEDYKWLERGLDYVTQLQEVETQGSVTSDAAYGGLTLRRVSPGDPIRGFFGDVPDFAMNVLPMTIEAENYDYLAIDGQGRSYQDFSAGNSGGAYRPAEGVDLSPASEGGFAISDIDSGEWVTYTISNPATGNYDIVIRYASTAPGGTIQLSLDGVDITGVVSVPHGGNASTGASDWHYLMVATDLPITQRVQQLRLNFGGVSDAFLLNSLTVDPDAADLVNLTRFTLEAGDITASTYQDPNLPSNTIDGDLETRWSANGDGEWIRFDLGEKKTVHFLRIAWLNGDTRVAYFDIEVSDDGSTWTPLAVGLESSGTTNALQTVEVTDTLTRYVRILGHGNSTPGSDWNSITEVEIWGTTPEPLGTPTMTPNGNGMDMTLDSIPGSIYQLQKSDSLDPVDWQDIGDPKFGDGSSIMLSDPDAFDYDERFYRIVIQP